MTESVTIGVVGAGAIAQVAHLTALRRLEGARLVAICDNDTPKAQALARRFDIPDVYNDIEELLRFSKPDAVVVCTPNHLHEVHTITVLNAGAHVMCERPLALTEDGLDRVAAEQQASGKIVLVGMNHRYRRDIEAIREFVAGDELGALHAIRSGWYIFRPVGMATTWRERAAQSGGGVMMDLGLPLVDASLWLAGFPAVERVSASFARASGSEVEDSGCALLYCESGLTIFVDVSWRHVGPREKLWFEVMGREGSARIGRLGVFKEMHGQPVDVTPTPVDSGDAFTTSYRDEWQAFLDMIAGKLEVPDLEERRALHRVMEAIRRSATEGREITL